MTVRALAWVEQKWITGAIHVLQTQGYLTKGMFRKETGIKGNTVTWKIAGSGEATLMSNAIENRPTLNADRTVVNATMQDWEANEWVGAVDPEKMSENEQQVVQQTIGMAIGRRFDKIPFGVMDAAAGAITTIGNGATNLLLENLFDGQAQLYGQGVNGNMMLNVAIPFRFLASLRLQKGWSSADYVTDNPLMRTMGARQFEGMRVVPMPDSYFNVPAANQADGYMWFTDAVGFATPTDEEGRIAAATRVDYVAEKKNYFAANTMSATSAVLLATGVRRLRFSTNAALTSAL